MCRYIFILLLFLILSEIDVAQEVRIISYDNAISIALNESYSIKSYNEAQKSMEFSYLYYKAMFKPRFDLNLFAPAWDEEVTPIYKADSLPVYNSIGSVKFGGDLRFTYVLPTGGNLSLQSTLFHQDLKNTLANSNIVLRNSQFYSQLGVGFEQPIFTANTLKENLKEAEYNYMISKTFFTRQQMNIIYQVTQGFFELYRAKQEVEIAAEKAKNSLETYRIAKLKEHAGRIPEGDVLIAEVAAAQNSAKLLENEGGLEGEKDRFKQLIGIDLSEKIEIVTDIAYDSVYVDLDKAITEAINNRLELNENDYNTSLKEIELERAKREREIKGKISAYYDITGVSTLNQGSVYDLMNSSFNNTAERPPNRGITFTLSVPIADWGRGSSKVSKAKVELIIASQNKENTLTTIKREVREVVRVVNDSYHKVKIYEKNVKVARKSYQVSLLRFENGEITSQQLSTEQERLSESQLAFLDSYIVYKLALVDLKRKTMWDFKNNRSYLNEVDQISTNK